MPYTTLDLIPDSALAEILDLTAAIVARTKDVFGVGDEAYVTTLTDSGVTGAAVPTAGGAMVLGPEALPDNFPPVGTVIFGPYEATIQINGPADGETVTVGGQALTGEDPWSTDPNTFDVSGNNAADAAALAQAINSIATAGIAGIVLATAVGNIVTVKVLPQFDFPPFPLTTSASGHYILSSTAFGGTYEHVRYNAYSGTTITVQERGADDTRPSAHPENAPVFLSSTVDRIALRVNETINGDGVDLVGVGALAGKVVGDLTPGMQDQYVFLRFDTQKIQIAQRWYTDLDTHLGWVARDVLTALPSYGPFAINDLRDYLRYKNDRTVGTAFSLLAPDAAADLYWAQKGGLTLYGQTVMPDRTKMLRYTQPNHFDADIGLLNRYSVDDSAARTGVRTQGYAAQRVRARVEVAGAGSATLIKFKAQGQHVNGVCFGRPRTVTVTVGSTPTGTADQPNNGDNVVINGITFQCVTTTPGTPQQYQRGADNTLTATAFSDAFNTCAATFPALVGMVATATDNLLVIQPAADDLKNYTVVSDNATRLGLSAGTLTAQLIVTFGGGYGEATTFTPGTGSDSQQTGDATDDDPREFTNNGVTLDLSVLGACVDLVVPAATDDRVLQIIKDSWVVSTTATSGGERITIETVPDRHVF